MELTLDTLLTVTDKGSILMPNGILAKPGDKVTPRDFGRHTQNLQTLIREGNLAAGDVEVTGIDFERGGAAPALPHTIDGSKTVVRSQAGGNEAATMAKLDEIKRRQAAEEAQAALAREAEAARLAALQELADADEELTPEEAEALGILRSAKS